MRTRMFPKCFKSNIYAVSFYDLISDHYSDLKTDKEFIRLCKTYTSLLCGLHFLNRDGDLEKIKKRFKRFLLQHHYEECDWDAIFLLYKRSIQLHSRSIWERMDPAHREECQGYQNQLEEIVFHNLKAFVLQDSKKLKMA